jgi:hypothetical protein
MKNFTKPDHEFSSSSSLYIYILLILYERVYGDYLLVFKFCWILAYENKLVQLLTGRRRHKKFLS